MWVINGTLLTILTEASILNRDEMTFGMGFICDHFFDQCPDINQARTAMIVSIILFTILYKALQVLQTIPCLKSSQLFLLITVI